jgi:hypothetical protein
LIAPLIAAFGVVLWMLLPAREALFRGKPESYWITNINYFGTSEQTAQWRGFGPDGMRFLAGALDRTYGWPYTYRKTYRRYAYRLPAFVTRRLPAPVEPRHTQMCILSLLSQMSEDTNCVRFAEPAVARALKDDDHGVCGVALGWYESGGPLMSAEARRARLPDFLRLMQGDDQWLRNNAAVALAHFRNEASTVAPVLAKALQETNPQIRITIAGALATVDPQVAVQSGVVPIAIEILRNPDDQIAYRAAMLLGRLVAEPALSVPALIEGTRSTNDLVAIDSMAALVKFREPMEMIAPALTNALTHRHARIRRYARDALQRIEAGATANAK